MRKTSSEQRSEVLRKDIVCKKLEWCGGDEESWSQNARRAEALAWWPQENVLRLGPYFPTMLGQ